jgi:hypothetical protein
VLWTRNAVSPVIANEELAVVLTDDSSGLALRVVSRGAPAWSEEWVVSSSANTHADKRGFDLAYEATSGDVLVVYGVDTPTPAYRTQTASGWSSEQALPLNDGAGSNPDPNSGTVLWVELVSRPGSDEISLLYADTNADLVAVTWDGAQWDTAAASALETSLKANPNSGVVHQRAFDGAYEGTSGNFLVAWGVSGSANYKSVVRQAGSTAWTNPKTVSIVQGYVEFVDLDGNLGSNLVVGTFLDQGNGTERLGLATWNGSDWINVGEYDSQIRDVNDAAYGDFPSAVAWVGSTANAVCVYADNHTAQIDWALWDVTNGWVDQTGVAVTGMGAVESVEMTEIPGRNAVMAVISDDQGQLWSAVYDSGGTWSVAGPHSTALSSLATMPFSVAFQAQ